MGRASEGALAGAAGLVALAAFEVVERRLLGRAPVYAPARLAARLAARFGVSLDAKRARGAGLLLRCLYGPGLGALMGWRARRPHAPARRGLEAGALIGAFELLALPLVGATPRLAAWPRAELALLLAHAGVFGVATELARSALRLGSE